MFYRPEEDHGLPHNPFNAIVTPRPIEHSVPTLSSQGISMRVEALYPLRRPVRAPNRRSSRGRNAEKRHQASFHKVRRTPCHSARLIYVPTGYGQRLPFLSVGVVMASPRNPAAHRDRESSCRHRPSALPRGTR